MKKLLAKLLFKLYNYSDPVWAGWGEVPQAGPEGPGRLEFLRDTMLWAQNKETAGFFIEIETRYKRVQGQILDMQKHPERHDHLLELIGQAKALLWVLEYLERCNREGSRLAESLAASTPRERESGGK